MYYFNKDIRAGADDKGGTIDWTIASIKNKELKAADKNSNSKLDVDEAIKFYKDNKDKPGLMEKYAKSINKELSFPSIDKKEADSKKEFMEGIKNKSPELYKLLMEDIEKDPALKKKIERNLEGKGDPFAKYREDSLNKLLENPPKKVKEPRKDGVIFEFTGGIDENGNLTGLDSLFGKDLPPIPKIETDTRERLKKALLEHKPPVNHVLISETPGEKLKQSFTIKAGEERTVSATGETISIKPGERPIIKDGKFDTGDENINVQLKKTEESAYGAFGVNKKGIKIMEGTIGNENKVTTISMKVSLPTLGAGSDIDSSELAIVLNEQFKDAVVRFKVNEKQSNKTTTVCQVYIIKKE